MISVDPSQAQDRRRAARRPHPDERDRRIRGAGLHALARDARRRQRDLQALPRRRSRRARRRASTWSSSRPRASGRATRRSSTLADVSLYVMTPEYGAATQLEKIDMLDFADFVAINKFDRTGAADALRDVRKQYQRNRERFKRRPATTMPVFGTIASRFNDDGVTALYQAIAPKLVDKGLKLGASKLAGGRRRAQSTGAERDHPAGAHALPRRDRRDLSRLPRSAVERRRRSVGARALEQLATATLERGCVAETGGGSRRSTGASTSLRRRARARARRPREEAARRCGRRPKARTRGDELRREGPRQGDPHARSPTRRCRARKHAEGRAAALRGRGRDPALAAARERAGQFPFTGRRVPVQARGRGPDAHVRRRGRRRAHQPALPLPARATACRRSACRRRSTR